MYIALAGDSSLAAEAATTRHLLQIGIASRVCLELLGLSNPPVVPELPAQALLAELPPSCMGLKYSNQIECLLLPFFARSILLARSLTLLPAPLPQFRLQR